MVRFCVFRTGYEISNFTINLKLTLPGLLFAELKDYTLAYERKSDWMLRTQPMQKNMDDCGIFVALTAQLFLQQKPIMNSFNAQIGRAFIAEQVLRWNETAASKLVSVKTKNRYFKYLFDDEESLGLKELPEDVLENLFQNKAQKHKVQTKISGILKKQKTTESK